MIFCLLVVVTEGVSIAQIHERIKIYYMHVVKACPHLSPKSPKQELQSDLGASGTKVHSPFKG